MISSKICRFGRSVSNEDEGWQYNHPLRKLTLNKQEGLNHVRQSQYLFPEVKHLCLKTSTYTSHNLFGTFPETEILTTSYRNIPSLPDSRVKILHLCGFYLMGMPSSPA